MLTFVTVLCFVAAVLAGDYAPAGLNFQGTFQGQCGNDGFYYMDGDSYVMCSNGNAYRQRCAPGSRNSPPSAYKHGQAAAATAFCDVNLVDYGYTLQFANSGKGGYGMGRQSGGFTGQFAGVSAGNKAAGFGLVNQGYGLNNKLRFASAGAGTRLRAGAGAGAGAGFGGFNNFIRGYGSGLGGNKAGFGGAHGGITFAQLGQPANKLGIGAGGFQAFSGAGAGSFGRGGKGNSAFGSPGYSHWFRG